MEPLQRVSFRRLRSNAKFVRPILHQLEKQMLQVVSLCYVALFVPQEQLPKTILSWIPPKVTMLHVSQ
jgi:hypothetical protein